MAVWEIRRRGGQFDLVLSWGDRFLRVPAPVSVVGTNGVVESFHYNPYEGPDIFTVDLGSDTDFLVVSKQLPTLQLPSWGSGGGIPFEPYLSLERWLPVDSNRGLLFWLMEDYRAYSTNSYFVQGDPTGRPWYDKVSDIWDTYIIHAITSDGVAGSPYRLGDNHTEQRTRYRRNQFDTGWDEMSKATTRSGTYRGNWATVALSDGNRVRIPGVTGQDVLAIDPVTLAVTAETSLTNVSEASATVVQELLTPTRVSRLAGSAYLVADGQIIHVTAQGVRTTFAQWADPVVDLLSLDASVLLMGVDAVTQVGPNGVVQVIPIDEGWTGTDEAAQVTFRFAAHTTTSTEPAPFVVRIKYSDGTGTRTWAFAQLDIATATLGEWLNYDVMGSGS